MTTAIAVAGLRKSYGEQLVLDGIDLAVQQGTVVALPGPNGAGKTTTVQILPTLIHSGGMQRKLGLSMTMVSDSQIIFLDEPTTGTAGTAGCHGAGN